MAQGPRQLDEIARHRLSDKTQYNFSLGYLNLKGIIVNTNYDRLTARASVKSKINDYIEFGGDINYMYSTTKGNNIGLGNNGNLSSQRDIAQMAPTLDYIHDATGEHVSVNVINPDEDSLCVYKVPYYRNVTKDELGFSMASDMKVM